jgi:hypothetical protein
MVWVPVPFSIFGRKPVGFGVHDGGGPAMSGDVSTFFSTEIDVYRGLVGKPLDRALSRLLKAFQGHIWGWTRTACRVHGDREFMYADDVFNVISLELSIELRKELTLASDPPIRNFYSYFKRISQRESFAYFHSGERTGFSNASGATRRTSKINKTRKELGIEMGREPSDQEVVDEVNRAAHATRSDPKKQGALVTLDDMKVTSFASLDGLNDEFGDSIWETETDEESAISSIEAPTLVRYVIEACERVSYDLGEVAKLWIGDALASPPVVRTSVEIAEIMELKRSTTGDLLDDCKDIAVAVCEKEFAISSPFV